MGLIVAGICFITPAVLITALFAWAYSIYGSLPEVRSFIYGIKPAVIALIISALVSLSKTAFKNKIGILFGLLTFGACLLGMNEITALFTCGFAGALLHYLKQNKENRRLTPVVLLNSNSLLAITGINLFWTFLKIGALLYGSGYVLFSFLDAELVQKGLLSRKQLIDAIAVGQLTPGPLFSSATFVGWQIGGIQGALAATVGIFLPSFVFVALLTPIIPRLRRSKMMSAFLDAVNAASVAVIAIVCVHMCKDTISDWKTALIASVTLIGLLIFKKLNSALVVLTGAVSGYLLLLI